MDGGRKMEHTNDNILQDPTHVRVQEYLNKFDMGLKVIEFINVSTKTSELAADALGVTVGEIAKSLLFMGGEKPAIVVTCGDKRIDTKKLKGMIGAKKVSFAKEEEVKYITGYTVGGVCPLNLPNPENVKVFLDKCLRDYPKVYLAAGTPYSAIPITIDELREITGGEIIDVSI
jgi:prolyl-tRNA editing enzyme YbaK/EbsC (Cys-tRNA(Pro) deacylase)